MHGTGTRARQHTPSGRLAWAGKDLLDQVQQTLRRVGKRVVFGVCNRGLADDAALIPGAGQCSWKILTSARLSSAGTVWPRMSRSKAPILHLVTAWSNPRGGTTR